MLASVNRFGASHSQVLCKLRGGGADEPCTLIRLLHCVHLVSSAPPAPCLCGWSIQWKIVRTKFTTSVTLKARFSGNNRIRSAVQPPAPSVCIAHCHPRPHLCARAALASPTPPGPLVHPLHFLRPWTRLLWIRLQSLMRPWPFCV